jgi:hypothetical protein
MADQGDDPDRPQVFVTDQPETPMRHTQCCNEKEDSMPLITDGTQPLTRARARGLKIPSTQKKDSFFLPSFLSFLEEESLGCDSAREGRVALSQGRVAWR